MQFKKRSKNFLIFLILISFTATAFASPKVNRLKEGETIPYTGWCFNDVAMAKIIADKELEGARCQLRLNEQAEKLSAKFKLDVGTLEARLSAVQSEHDSILKIKNEEIERLEAAALERPNDYWYLFTAGGFVVGAASVLVVWSVMVN